MPLKALVQWWSPFSHRASNENDAIDSSSGQITAPYGTWKSSITAELIAGERIALDSPKVARDGKQYYIEGRPTGKNCLVELDGEVSRDVLPEPYSARSAVHEYGGGAYAVLPSGNIVFTDIKTKKVLLLNPATKETKCLIEKVNCKYADFEPHPSAPWIVAIEEDHEDPMPSKSQNFLVLFNSSSGETIRLTEGADFYTTPRFSPDGCSICWLQWDHPDMPWTGAQVYVADIDKDGKLDNITCLAGKAGKESVAEPKWSPTGDLFFLRDTPGYYEFAFVKAGDWKNKSLVRVESLQLAGQSPPSLGGPEWTLGRNTYLFLTSDQIIAASTIEGTQKLVSIGLPNASWEVVAGPWSSIQNDALTRVSDTSFLLIGGCVDRPDALYFVEMDSRNAQPQDPAKQTDGLGTSRKILKSSLSINLPASTFSSPEHITVTSTHSPTTYGFFFPPHNLSYKGPINSRPPLIVLSHGGPTSSFNPGLVLSTQYWTNRGYAVFCLNYRGSSGYGRKYIEQLDGEWGVADVADAVVSVKFLADRIDTSRVGIRGGSAGGYCVLQSLCEEKTNSTWAGGVSAYGISDLRGLVEDTHKFESRYMNRLLFSPNMTDAEKDKVLRDRSATSHPERIKSPLLLLQGTEDKVVPPEQSKKIEKGASAAGADVRLVMFEGEGHGFRMKENVERSLQEEEKWWLKTLVRQ